MNVATICYLLKTMVNFANMLYNKLRLCYTWTLVWTWRKTPVAKLFLFSFSLYLWVVNNSGTVHTPVLNQSYAYLGHFLHVLCNEDYFQLRFAWLSIPFLFCVTYFFIQPQDTCKLQVYSQKRDRLKNCGNTRVIERGKRYIMLFIFSIHIPKRVQRYFHFA